MPATTGTMFRGVTCKHCRKPIRLSVAVLNRKQQNLPPDLVTKVFPGRCKSCRREALYSLDEISEFPDEQRRFTDKRKGY